MTSKNLKELKQFGHSLLEEYVALYRGKLSQKKIRNEAYKTIEKKLVHFQHSHFSLISSEEEAKEVINILRHMILKREKANQHLGVDKIKFAPNVQELQRRASELNKNILMA